VVPPDVVAAATSAFDELIKHGPPGPDVRGPFNYITDAVAAPALAALLTASPAYGLAESLTGPGTLERPWQMQVTLNIPPYPHRPGMHHLDGAPGEADGRPGTFTMLAGVLMSDQRGQDAGNLWVWPGTHLTHAEYFREHGPEALLAAGGYPPIRLPAPEQVTGQAGDLVLAHYLLGHNIGGNTSPAVRRAVYFRLKQTGHNPRWREFLQDPWLDYDAVRERVRGGNGEYNPG
jgi:phytanoyl-CoA dioxygenase PhyH